MMKQDLQQRVAIAGLEILEVRITHLSYAPEIAAAMLQRQQAEAIVAAGRRLWRAPWAWWRWLWSSFRTSAL